MNGVITLIGLCGALGVRITDMAVSVQTLLGHGPGWSFGRIAVLNRGGRTPPPQPNQTVMIHVLLPEGFRPPEQLAAANSASTRGEAKPPPK